MDFEDAFGSVWKSKVMEKLYTEGINCKMLKWIYSFINQCFIATKFEKMTSRYKLTEDYLKAQLSVQSILIWWLMICYWIKKKNEGIKYAFHADQLAISAPKFSKPTIK